MANNPIFSEWIAGKDHKPFGKGKYHSEKYIMALRDNVEIVFPQNLDAKNCKRFLDLLEERLDLERYDIDDMVEKLTGIYRLINVLKADTRKFLLMFGQEFGWSQEISSKFNPIESVGDCRTALDRYARYLMGVASNLVQHAEYTRDYYDKNYTIKPLVGSNLLVLPNEWKKMRTLVNDYQSMESALDTKRFKNKYGLSQVKHRKGEFYFYFE